jgi:hypothetical protein
MSMTRAICAVNDIGSSEVVAPEELKRDGMDVKDLLLVASHFRRELRANRMRHAALSTG